MKKKTTIYPYSISDVQFVRYSSFLSDIEPVFAVSPPGWGYIGKDATAIDGGKASGLLISEDLFDALKNSEILIITSFEEYYGKKGGLKDTLQTAIDNKKPFYLAFTLTPEEKIEVEELLNIAKAQGLFQEIPSPENNYQYYQTLDYCAEINVPVILVMGQGPKTSKFETQLGIRNELINQGLKVTQIGSKPYCELFGFHSFPSFMFSKEINETEKVINLNHFVKILEEKENPDIIVVGIPGGIMPIINKTHNQYGILHIEVSSALEPDSIIFNLYSNGYTRKYYDKMSDLLYYRFNHAKTSCFVLTNNWVDYSALTEKETFQVSVFDRIYDKIIETPSNNIPVVSILEANAFSKIARANISVLETYGSVNFY